MVVNDDGGSIFAMLEQGAPAHADRFEALFGTPHGVDLAALCAATRTPHLRVESLPELEQALASPNGGIEVVEVPVRRDDRRDLDARIRARRGRARRRPGTEWVPVEIAVLLVAPRRHACSSSPPSPTGSTCRRRWC